MNLTVVIATRNRPKQVFSLVEDIERWHCEVIVVDDCSREPLELRSAKVVRNLQRCGSSESWNVGSRQAKQDWLLLIADDLIPSPELGSFIRELLPKLKSRDIVGLRIHGIDTLASRATGYQNTITSRMINILFGVDIAHRSGFSRFIPGAMIIYKEFFTSLGGFDSRTFGGNGFREESDLQWRARKKGGRLIYIENPNFKHLNVSGGYEKRDSLDDIYYIRNQTVFALRTRGPAALVVIPAFSIYLLANGMWLSTLAKGIAQGITMVLRN